MKDIAGLEPAIVAPPQLYAALRFSTVDSDDVLKRMIAERALAHSEGDVHKGAAMLHIHVGELERLLSQANPAGADAVQLKVDGVSQSSRGQVIQPAEPKETGQGQGSVLPLKVVSNTLKRAFRGGQSSGRRFTDSSSHSTCNRLCTRMPKGTRVWPQSCLVAM